MNENKTKKMRQTDKRELRAIWNENTKLLYPYLSFRTERNPKIFGTENTMKFSLS